MVAAHHQPGLCAGRIDQCANADVAAEQVVEPCRGDELAAETHQRRRLGVVQAEFVVEHPPPPSSAASSARRSPDTAGELPQQRLDIGLGIDAALAVDVAVEVDGQTRNDRHRPAQIDQAGSQRAVGAAHHDAPGEGQVAIEPGVEQHAAIDFDAELEIAAPIALGIGPHHQTGAVGMGTQHADAVAMQRVGTEREGDDRGAVAHRVVAATGLQRPVRGFVERGETGRAKQCTEIRGGMEGRRRARQKVQQPGVEFLAGHQGTPARRAATPAG